MKLIFFYAAIVNLIFSGLLFLNNALLLLFQKNCEFCSILIGPVILFGLFGLVAYISFRWHKTIPLSGKRWLMLINCIGILIAAIYMVKTYDLF